MSFDISDPRTQFALEAVRKAAQVTQMVQSVDALTKDDRSPVTVADFSAQAVVGRLLADAFPSDILVAEEDAAALRAAANAATLEAVADFVKRVCPDATPEAVCDWIDHGGSEPTERFWTLDPVDGTKGFIRGDQYAVTLAHLVDGQVELGVLGCPNLDEECRPGMRGGGAIIVAVRGQGTWATPLAGEDTFVPLRVSDCREPAPARVMRSFEAAHTNTNQLDVILEAMGVRGDPVRMDSQAKYGVLAAGYGDLLFRLLSAKQPDYREKIWDQAAGSIILEEAGGRITDLAGAALDFTRGRTLAANRGVLASNGGPLHDLALEALSSQ